MVDSLCVGTVAKMVQYTDTSISSDTKVKGSLLKDLYILDKANWPQYLCTLCVETMTVGNMGLYICERETSLIIDSRHCWRGNVTARKKAILILMLLNLKLRLKDGNLYWAAVNFVVWGILTWNVIKGFVIYYSSGPFRIIFCGLCSGKKEEDTRRNEESLCSPKTCFSLFFSF